MRTIVVKDLCKAFSEQPVLNGVSFTASAGKVTCVMAPSGTGKTTLLRILLGLERPDSGSVEVAKDFRWAAVFQEDRLLERLDAAGNLRFALGREYNDRQAEMLLRTLGLEMEPGKPVREWSGGMKRRLALTRALLASADALVLDEPFTGLDEENRNRCLACIRAAAAEKPVLLVTHEPEDAAALKAEVIRL